MPKASKARKPRLSDKDSHFQLSLGENLLDRCTEDQTDQDALQHFLASIDLPLKEFINEKLCCEKKIDRVIADIIRQNRAELRSNPLLHSHQSKTGYDNTEITISSNTHYELIAMLEQFGLSAFDFFAKIEAVLIKMTQNPRAHGSVSELNRLLRSIEHGNQTNIRPGLLDQLRIKFFCDRGENDISTIAEEGTKARSLLLLKPVNALFRDALVLAEALFAAHRVTEHRQESVTKDAKRLLQPHYDKLSEKTARMNGLRKQNGATTRTIAKCQKRISQLMARLESETSPETSAKRSEKEGDEVAQLKESLTKYQRQLVSAQRSLEEIKKRIHHTGHSISIHREALSAAAEEIMDLTDAVAEDWKNLLKLQGQLLNDFKIIYTLWECVVNICIDTQKTSLVNRLEHRGSELSAETLEQIINSKLALLSDAAQQQSKILDRYVQSRKPDPVSLLPHDVQKMLHAGQNAEEYEF